MLTSAPQRETYDQIDQLAAFQAYLIYSMMLFFSPKYGQIHIGRQVMVNLLDFACDAATTGVGCPAELTNSLPDWESWIVACTKRRTLYTVYFFDNVFCTTHDLPTVLGVELESLPAPAGKTLWEASNRTLWEERYTAHLAEWPDGALRIDELWPGPEVNRDERRRRVDRWLETVDEFGMMMFTVTHLTHGT